MTTPTDTAVQLKPCPFCGGPAELCISRAGAHWVRCIRAGACPASVDPVGIGYRHADDAAEAWNTRATIPKANLADVQTGEREAAESAPPYYAKDGAVRRRSVTTDNLDGSQSMSLDFPICEMHEVVGVDAAETIAALMNAGDRAPSLQAEVARFRAALEEIANGCTGRVDKDELPCLIARAALTETQEKQL